MKDKNSHILMKRVLLTLVFLAVIQQLSAQRPLVFSVHASPQFAWFSTDDDDVLADGSIFHIHTGLNMDLFFDKNYAFALGIGVNNVGGNLLYGDTASFISESDTMMAFPGQHLKQNLQYIDIPIGLKLKTEELGYATFFLQLGFNPMINIKATATSTDETFDKTAINESTYLFSLGYHAGIGVEYRLGGKNCCSGWCPLELRFDRCDPK